MCNLFVCFCCILYFRLNLCLKFSQNQSVQCSGQKQTRPWVVTFCKVHFKFWPTFFFSSGIEDNPTIFYQLIRGSTDQTNKYDTFYLQQRQENGWTYADVKVNQPLDFERIKEYNLTIRVEVRMSKYFISIKLSSISVSMPKSPKTKNMKNMEQTFEYNLSRTMAPSSWPVRRLSSSCWRMSTTKSLCSPRGSRRPWWRESPSVHRSLGTRTLC